MKGKQSKTHEALIEVIHSRKQLAQLYLLAFSLTGCQEAAERRLLEAMEDTHDSFLLSAEFTFSATKRATIKRSLQHVASELQHFARQSDDHHVSMPNPKQGISRIAEDVLPKVFWEALFSLNVFHRAVLILRIYERFQENEAALLLRVPLDVLRRGQAHGLQALLSAMEEHYFQNSGRVDLLKKKVI